NFFSFKEKTAYHYQFVICQKKFNQDDVRFGSLPDMSILITGRVQDISTRYRNTVRSVTPRALAISFFFNPYICKVLARSGLAFVVPIFMPL
ncbi:MAG: hypothetical protein VST69_06280, partial [Nitrospirota bacterium]|nr:hypothetical protein [Nitrospirota bacterium]